MESAIFNGICTTNMGSSVRSVIFSKSDEIRLLIFPTRLSFGSDSLSCVLLAFDSGVSTISSLVLGVVSVCSDELSTSATAVMAEALSGVTDVDGDLDAGRSSFIRMRSACSNTSSVTMACKYV